MPSASMPQTPRGALAVMRQGPCEQIEQRMPCSQNWQRLLALRLHAVEDGVFAGGAGALEHGVDRAVQAILFPWSPWSSS